MKIFRKPTASCKTNQLTIIENFILEHSFLNLRYDFISYYIEIEKNELIFKILLYSRALLFVQSMRTFWSSNIFYIKVCTSVSTLLVDYISHYMTNQCLYSMLRSLKLFLLKDTELQTSAIETWTFLNTWKLDFLQASKTWIQ